jgi:hypothetical protein
MNISSPFKQLSEDKKLPLINEPKEHRIMNYRTFEIIPRIRKSLSKSKSNKRVKRGWELA